MSVRRVRENLTHGAMRRREETSASRLRRAAWAPPADPTRLAPSPNRRQRDRFFGFSLWVQNLILPPLSALAELFDVRAYDERSDSEYLDADSRPPGCLNLPDLDMS